MTCVDTVIVLGGTHRGVTRGAEYFVFYTNRLTFDKVIVVI